MGCRAIERERENSDISGQVEQGSGIGSTKE
jgi:hypothetical protein